MPTQTSSMSLRRTAKALAEYDAGTGSGEAVGVAYGLDTIDRNDPATCAAVIRPGKKNPSHPSHLSFVRRMVASYGDPR